MYKVKFNFKGQETMIQCKNEDKIKQICNRFALKANIGISNIYFVYNGNIINENLKIEDQINNDDKMRKEIYILVQEKDKNTINENFIKSKDIICPKCQENILLNINNYKINLNQCKNGHSVKNICLKDFNDTQNIDISKIICDICKIKNKNNTYKNEFYKCNECKINICPLCKSKHNNNHNIINYDKKDYICDTHNDNFTKYCKDCNENICMRCERKHINHKTIYFGDILPNEENLIKDINEFKIYIDKLNNEIKDIINKLKDVMNNLELYYNISKNVVINNNNNKNYQVLYNINEFINNNNLIIEDIKEIINEKDISNKFKNIFNIYNTMNKNDNYIIAEIYIEEEDINKDVRIINSFEQAKIEFKWGDNENDNKFENEKEIKEKCEIKINNQKIPFSYFYKFNKGGKHIIKYTFNNNLTKADYLFYGCESLTNINLTNFNTEKITNMREMFGECNSLTDINLSYFNTENVINMEGMFNGCYSLLNVNLSNFDTHNVTCMSGMFNECNSLTILNLSNFNTKNVIDMSYMFNGCKSLTEINLLNFNTQHVNNICGIFRNVSLNKKNLISNDNKILNQLL